MGQLVFQATLGGQVNLVGPNTASIFNLNVPAVAGTLVTTGDTGTVTSTMLATSVYTAPGTIGSGTANSGAFTTLSASSTVSGTGFSTYLASPPAIGGTAAAAGTFTTLTGSTSVTTPIVKSASSLTLQSNGTTTAITIDTSQRVIAGYTASVGTAYQTMMQVKGQGSASTYAGYSLTTSNNESAGLFGVYSNAENSLWIASDPDNLRAGSRTVFTVDGTQTAQINPFGIGVGTATPTSGIGIAFPATQSASSDANTLDDYEEGTWTPTVSFSGGNGTLSYTSRVGSYVKIGSTVFISMSLTINKGTASGTFDSISGLPFTSSINAGGGAYCDNFTVLSGAPEWTIASGGAILYYYSTGTGSATAINATSFGTASVLRVFASYTTSS